MNRNNNTKKKKPFYKNKLFILLITFFIIGSIPNSTNKNSNRTNNGSVKNKSIEKETKKSDQASIELDDTRKDRNPPIASSNLPAKKIKTSKIKSVGKDETGDLKYISVSNQENLEPYLLDILNKNMEESDVLFIINNETEEIYSINNTEPNYYNISLYKYVRGEEKNANILPSGPIKKEFDLYKDNGDIYEVEIPKDILALNKQKEKMLKEKTLIRQSSTKIDRYAKLIVEEKEMRKIKNMMIYDTIIYSGETIHDFSGNEYPITFLVTGRYEEKNNGRLNDVIMVLGFKKPPKEKDSKVYLLQYFNQQTGNSFNSIPEDEDVLLKLDKVIKENQ